MSEPLLSPELTARLDALDLVTRKVLRGSVQGDRRSKRRGQSVEFADYRPYSVGDDLRRIDWNLFGRLDKLFLRLFLEEEDLSATVLIDASTSMRYGQPQKLRYGLQLAAVLGYIGLSHQNTVSVHTFDRELRPGPTGLRGRRSVQPLLTHLEAVASDAEPDPRPARGPGRPAGDPGAGLEAALRELALLHPRPGVVVVVSDFMFKQEVADAMRVLAHPRFDAHAIQLLSPQEVDPSVGGVVGDLRLTDLEDGDAAEVSATPRLLERYRVRLAAFCQHVRSACHSRGVGYYTATTDKPLETAVLRYFQQTGLLR